MTVRLSHTHRKWIPAPVGGAVREGRSAGSLPRRDRTGYLRAPAGAPGPPKSFSSRSSKAAHARGGSQADLPVSLPALPPVSAGSETEKASGSAGDPDAAWWWRPPPSCGSAAWADRPEPPVPRLRGPPLCPPSAVPARPARLSPEVRAAGQGNRLPKTFHTPAVSPQR